MYLKQFKSGRLDKRTHTHTHTHGPVASLLITAGSFSLDFGPFSGFENFVVCRLVLAMTHLHTKFEMSSFIHSRDTEGVHYVTGKIGIAHVRCDVIKMLG